MRAATRPTIRWLALIFALLLLVGVGLYTLRQGAIVRACDPVFVGAEATVLVADEVRATFGLPREATQEPIEVAPGQLVEVIVALTPQPAGCADAFEIDWELSFVVFTPHEIRTFFLQAASVPVVPPSASSGLSMGSFTVKVVPLPTSLLSSVLPLCLPMMP